jgi:hypothetical protein
MSALGHKRTFGLFIAMSALLPKADIVHGGGNVRFVPKADIGATRSPCAHRLRHEAAQ